MSSDRVLVSSAPARAVIAVMIAAALILTLSVARASAAPVSQVYTGQSGGATPDIEKGSLTFFDTSGDPISSGGAAGTLNFTLAGIARVGYCVDTSKIFNEGTELVDVTSQDAPTTAANRALTWILLNRTPTGTPTPEKQTQAAVSQVATWLLVDAQINKTTPTSDPAVNAAAFALVQEALAATATPASLALSAAAPAAGATSTTVTVTGRAGASVTLSVASGAGTLSATQVVIGAGGTATVTLTSAQPGSVVLSATTAGDGRLILINPVDPERVSQPTAAAEPNQLTAGVSVAFSAAPTTTPPGTPNTPTITATPVPRLSIAKAAPASARVLSKVRYQITVRNTGKVTALNVVVKDRIPVGLSFVSSTRDNTLSKGTLVFDLGNLKAGAVRTFYVVLQANAKASGTRTNTATVSANRVKPLSASASTLFRPLVRRVQPAVTG